MTAWVTADEVRAYLGADIVTTDDAETLALGATSLVSDFISRDLELHTEAFAWYDANGTNYILAHRYPVRTIGSLTYQGTLLRPWMNPQNTPQGYRIEGGARRKIVFEGFDRLVRQPRAIQITNIVSGYDLTAPPGSDTALPSSVKRALLLTASALFAAQAADPNLTSESTAGVFSGAFHAGGVGSIPPGARTLLLAYERVA